MFILLNPKLAGQILGDAGDGQRVSSEGET